MRDARHVALSCMEVKPEGYHAAVKKHVFIFWGSTRDFLFSAANGQGGLGLRVGRHTL
jgi:hypothetical protein